MTVNRRKITVKDLRQALKMHDEINRTTVEWKGLALTIKNTLDLLEMKVFVDTVVAACSGENGLEYHPEWRDFAIRCATVELYSNITLPESIKDKCMVVYDTDIFPVVSEYLNSSQLKALIRAADDKLSKIADQGVALVRKELNGVIAGFEEIQTKLSEMFAGISGEEFSNVLSSLANTEIDEEKLIKAYLPFMSKNANTDAKEEVKAPAKAIADMSAVAQTAPRNRTEEVIDKNNI